MLTILTGIVLPSSIVCVVGPSGFSELNGGITPLSFIFKIFSISAGFFICWFSLFYYLCDERLRRLASMAVPAAGITAGIIYLMLGRYSGSVPLYLQPENIPGGYIGLCGISIAIFAVLSFLLYCFRKIGRKRIECLLILFTACIAGISIFNIVKIRG